MRTTITGTLDYTQNKGHIPHAFTLPAGATKLNIQFDYSPKISQGETITNELSLTLFDPESCRGARHNNRDRALTITEDAATPGYIPGLKPGTWTVWIDSHRVLPPDLITYQFEIDISNDPVTEDAPIYTPGTTAPRGAGWYRGDLHGHTLHSDGRWGVPGLVGYAREYGLDFVTLSDHNTVAGLHELDSLRDDSLLTIDGMELTTYYGHCLALGVRAWQEWRIDVEGITMPELARRARANGATFIIAHPTADGDPACTGCDWGYPDMMPGSGRIVEVWNSAWDGDRHNEQALQLWHRWLNAGYRMVGTRGSDIHGPLDYANIGFDVVYADELSEAAILRAVRAGHLYVSAGPRLEFTAQGSDGSRAIVGDRITGDLAEIRLTWDDCSPGDTLRMVAGGEIVEESPIDRRGDRQWTLREGNWCAVEIRRPDGQMRAFTNPIFLPGFVEKPAS